MNKLNKLLYYSMYLSLNAIAMHNEDNASKASNPSMSSFVNVGEAALPAQIPPTPSMPVAGKSAFTSLNSTDLKHIPTDKANSTPVSAEAVAQAVSIDTASWVQGQGQAQAQVDAAQVPEELTHTTNISRPGTEVDLANMTSVSERASYASGGVAVSQQAAFAQFLARFEGMERAGARIEAAVIASGETAARVETVVIGLQKGFEEARVKEQNKNAEAEETYVAREKARIAREEAKEEAREKALIVKEAKTEAARIAREEAKEEARIAREKARIAREEAKEEAREKARIAREAKTEAALTALTSRVADVEKAKEKSDKEALEANARVADVEKEANAKIANAEKEALKANEKVEAATEALRLADEKVGDAWAAAREARIAREEIERKFQDLRNRHCSIS